MNSELSNRSTLVQISDCFIKKNLTQNSFKKYKKFMNSKSAKISPNFRFSLIKRAHRKILLEVLFKQAKT